VFNPVSGQRPWRWLIQYTYFLLTAAEVYDHQQGLTPLAVEDPDDGWRNTIYLFIN
jgi:hypothetical protein